MSNKSIKSSSTLESKCFSDSSSLKSVKSIKSKAKERVIKKFTYEHLNLLENLFIEDPQWSRATIQKAAEIIGSTRRKIYKWGYDKKSKPVYHIKQSTKNESKLIRDFTEINKMNTENTSDESLKANKQFSKEIDYNNEVELLLKIEDKNNKYEETSNYQNYCDLSEIESNKNTKFDISKTSIRSISEYSESIFEQDMSLFKIEDQLISFEEQEFSMPVKFEEYKRQISNPLSNMREYCIEDIIRSQIKFEPDNEFQLFEELYESNN